MFVVYRVSGTLSDQAYYGYTVNENDIKSHWLLGAKRSEDRGDSALFKLNNCDADLISVQVLDVSEDEVEAWMLRNDYRSSELDSITGPTNWPSGMLERAEQQAPGRSDSWKLNMEMRNASTARQAMQLGKWTFQDIKALSEKYDKKQIVRDLDTLTPYLFQSKYFE